MTLLEKATDTLLLNNDIMKEWVQVKLEDGNKIIIDIPKDKNKIQIIKIWITYSFHDLSSVKKFYRSNTKDKNLYKAFIDVYENFIQMVLLAIKEVEDRDDADI